MTTASSTTAPVSASTDGAGSSSGYPSPMRERAVSLSDSEPRTLRSSRSRIMAQDISPSGSKVIRRAVSANALKSVARQEALRETSPSSSDDDLPGHDLDDRYGRPLHRELGAYTSVPLASPSRGGGSPSGSGGGGAGANAWDPVPDSELNTFAAQFRALVEQVSRETDEAVAYAQADRYSSGYYSGNDRDDAAARVVAVGRTIHRMPTIESLGSHEVMSLASMQGAASRPSTRSNTLSNGDAPPSRSGSRANSLDAWRLLVWAEEDSAGAQQDLAQQLWRAHFLEGADLGDPLVLASRAALVGLDLGAADALLASDDYADAVHRQDETARSLSIKQLPLVVVESRWTLAGAQSQDDYVQGLRQMYTQWREELDG